MIHLAQNVDLAPKITGLEMVAANAFDVAFLTANWKIRCFSLDTGKKFTAINPFDLLKPLGLVFCCGPRRTLTSGASYSPNGASLR